MKKSEFEKQRGEHWTRWGAMDVTQLVRRDIEAAEAAGIAWEPEAPALPERLEVRDQYAGEGGYFAFMACSQGNAPFDPRAVLAEAGRRYNAWPAIRAWAHGPDGPLSDVALNRFLAILDGPYE